MSEYDEPTRLGAALGELIARRGYARVEEHRQYREAWSAVAEEWKRHTQVSRVQRGQLIVEVDHAALVGELAGFHAAGLLARLQTEYPALKIKGLKFRLKGLS
jgi:hypothetical protein